MADRYTASPYRSSRQYNAAPASSSSHHHGAYNDNIDVDTVDYDDTGVPAPHHLATSHSVSPYPAPLVAPTPLSPARRHLNEMQELHAAPSGYVSQSPFRSSLALSPDTIRGGYLPTFDSHDTLYYQNEPKFGQYDDDGASTYYSHRDSGDAWAMEDAEHQGAHDSLAQSRDRYIKRKSAALAATESAYNLAPPKPARFPFLAALAPHKKYLIAAGSILAAIVFAVIIFFATRHNTNATIVDGPLTNSGPSGNPTAGVVKSDKSDPSKFDKDPRLHHSMYGICYTPFHAQYPSCGATQSNVTEDIQLLSQLTSRVRLYGSDCQTSQMVLEAIKQTKVDMTVFLAVWIDDNADTVQRQIDNVVDAVKTYGTDHIAGITVGNEYLLNGGSVTTLLAHIAAVNTTVNALPNLGKYIPIGTADAGSMVSTQLATGADYVMANVHPWFGGLPVDQAAGWIYEYTNTNEPSTALLAPNKPTLYVAEAGWPTGANQTSLMTYQGATAGIAELNTFLQTFVCQSNANFTQSALQPSFIFEAFDEPWKDVLYGGVEAHWGLFDANKKLKDGLVIPDCAAP
ncbi:Glycoside hydrolase, family 17 [Kalmanozyma brasiliensis GHG001]|uniref:glucan endo-1,3-beta-D-glucosidase n=1 Tax=Kalmanozyma brasiliensis (strain GHG001) TaxID=1365824 RepID=V5GN73_KALBG|nr:Glycoside hydrolase, family 17 [Kalmanozyma brasiliensis GHG001]EST07417.1 Glycoside hydrolase, family 17 [Kalmanozyma brasiliensis GHG001]